MHEVRVRIIHRNINTLFFPTDLSCKRGVRIIHRERRYIYIYVILICLLLFSALICSGELWFYLASKFTCILCLMYLLVCLGSYQFNLYLVFLYVSLYLSMYFQQFKWFLTNLSLATCILWYSLLFMSLLTYALFNYVFNQPG